MAALDNKMIALAFKLLKKFGKPSIYKQITQGVYDVDLGEVVNSETSVNVTIYISKVESGDIQSGLATADDIKIMVSSKELGVEAKQGDKIEADNIYEVKKILPTYSGSEIALYELICAKR